MQYIEDIVDDINNKYKQQNCDTRLNKIILWMDNCAGQFKSKYFFISKTAQFSIEIEH